MEEQKMEQQQDVQQTPEQPAPKPEDKQPSVKELTEQLQEAMNELAKVKRNQEKAASEAAEYKKKWKESMSATEQASLEKAEKEAEREEQFNQLLRENNINKVEKNYLAMGWTADEASRMAIAEVDGDIDTKVKIMSEVDARKKKDYEAEFLKNRPDVNIGGSSGVSYTKEQFEAMGLVERTRLYEENRAEYERLMAL
jgi:hypothetical protein